MSRTCGMCTHAERKRLEKQLLGGTPFRLIAVDAGLSETAISRHVRNHLDPALRKGLQSSTASLHLADFGDRLMLLVEETERVRELAKDNGDVRLFLQAIASERDTLGVLMGKLGIDSDEVIEYIAEARTLVEALRSVLAGHPAVADQLANTLRDRDPRLADAMRELARRLRTELN